MSQFVTTGSLALVPRWGSTLLSYKLVPITLIYLFDIRSAFTIILIDLARD